ncbi:hypothetical protein P154DRAFT_570707 [Amniculicola lignicola CBS 123094]|uniref:DUF7924 domain-containing protein n=1 Tax=Amniculicola lignicola CBS 123094 TaxID=1392246 RepID=A0A6A5WXX6_9PLEO|nr:hypothetical protein P154DRAFT_570707 [Amniculicola lignicola CBS 123094]
MASRSAPVAARKRRHMPNQTKNAQKHQGISKATRRSERIRCKDESFRTNAQQNIQESTEQEHLRQTERRAVEAKKRTRDPEILLSLERPRKRPRIKDPLQTKRHNQVGKQKRPREDETSTPHASLQTPAKRARTTTVAVQERIDEARIKFWRENGTWPTEEQEKTMDRFRDIVQHALPRKRSKSSLRRKRSDASISTETVQTRTPSDQQPREQKSAPYRHPRYEGQLQERGSFMDDHDEGITTESEKLLAKLLKTPRKPPEHTLFSDDILFKKTCKSLRGENETKVILRIADLIFPSAEILADRGAKHLEILRETTNAGWINAIPFYGPRPQPDFGLGFKREAFTPEQLRKLQPFIGNELEDCSYIAATYNMYLPFFTSEVKCGASALDVADRQNLHSQTVSLRNLVELFRLVGRLNELHREINSYSISHSDECVRIWAHYVVVKGEDFTFHRHSIAKFDISPTAEGDQRWKAWTFVMNVFDFWVPNHFQRICSAIDMLPAVLNFEVSNMSEPQHSDPELASSRSGLSQQLEVYSLAEKGAMSDNQSSNQPITPDTTIAGSGNSKKKKTKWGVYAKPVDEIWALPTETIDLLYQERAPATTCSSGGSPLREMPTSITAMTRNESPIIYVAGTGGGKSLAFLLPASFREEYGQTTAVVPLVLLMGFRAAAQSSRHRVRHARARAASRVPTVHVRRIWRTASPERFVIDGLRLVVQTNSEYGPAMGSLMELLGLPELGVPVTGSALRIDQIVVLSIRIRQQHYEWASDGRRG